VRRTKDRRQYRKGGYHLEPRLASTANLVSSSPSSKDKSKFTFVELFARIGGLRPGLESISGTCVMASERDEIACRIYRRHFHDDDDDDIDSDRLIECDMLDIASSDFPPHFHILTGGFPCQPFSARGSQPGFSDNCHRGQMYQELVRILMEVRPPFFLFENVFGLVTMEWYGRTCLSEWEGYGPDREDVGGVWV